jgi:hypothetical protein
VLQTLRQRESDTAKLKEAVAAYRQRCRNDPRARAARLGHMTQNNPERSALNSIRERESDTAKLEEAVAAYREALKEQTRDRVPLDWT